jgi:hypothetical protein
MVVNERVEVLVEEMAAGLDAWRRARAEVSEAVRRRDRAVARAERKLAMALGGMTLARWQRLTAGQASLRDPAVGRAVFLARRNRPRAEAALAELHQVRVVEAAKVAAAEAELDEAARRCSRWAGWLASE